MEWGFGDNPLQFNSNDKTRLPVKLDFKAKMVVCGWNHTMFIDMNNQVWGCGFNNYFAVGITRMMSLDFLRHDIINKPTNINMKAKKIACGDQFTMMIDEKNNLWGWGKNDVGQLCLDYASSQSIGPTITRYQVRDIACGSKSTFFIDTDNEVWLIEKNRAQIASPIQLQLKAYYISSGYNSTVIVSRTLKNMERVVI